MHILTHCIKNLNLLKVKDIFVMQSLKFYYDSLHNKLPSYFKGIFQIINEVREHNTRQSQTLHIPRYRRQRTSDSMRFNTPKVINQIPENITLKIQTHSFATVKIHAKKYFIEQHHSIAIAQIAIYVNRERAQIS